MQSDSPVQPSKEAIENSSNIWANFISATKICGGVIAIVLILMAVFLV